MSKPKVTFSFTIGAKLISLIAILLVSSVVSLVWLSTRMFIEDNTALIQKTNSDTAANLGAQAREIFESTIDKMRIVGTNLLTSGAPSGAAQTADPQADAMVSELFSKDKDFLAVYLFENNPSGGFTLKGKDLSPELASIGDPNGEQAITANQGDKDFSYAELKQGAPQISTIRLADGSSAISLGIPFVERDRIFTHVLVGLIRQRHFMKAFSESDLVTSFMVDRRGKLLAHPDEARVASSESMAHLSIVQQLMEGKFGNGQMRYLDPGSGEAKLGAYHLVGFGGLAVVTEVPEAKAFEAAKKVQYRATLIGLIILSIAFLAGYCYSGTITWPIKQLVAAAGRISAGDFRISLKPKGRDEIARLSRAFNEMARGLEERDRVKEVFNKFHNKEIADRLLSGDVKLGGERREAVIFFSDVRGFTSMSESMQPEQVVEMLNEYMTSMVSVIRKYGGVVDKYVGDAIMALWGIPIGTPDDAFKAVRAALAMREELAMLNGLRQMRGQVPIRIGMGLNMGPVIAGNIGSDEKMEYTVIGDSVNLASRVESMTKEFGTDLLISSRVYEQVKSRVVVEACHDVYVKGKAGAIELYKVKGYVNESGQPVLLETPYSSYTPEKSDKAGKPAVPRAPAIPPPGPPVAKPPVAPVTQPEVVLIAKPLPKVAA